MPSETKRLRLKFRQLLLGETKLILTVVLSRISRELGPALEAGWSRGA